MKKIILIILIFCVIGVVGKTLIQRSQTISNTTPQAWWNIQSVDTMKYSRDLAAARLGDPSFDKTIDQQVKAIADIGATHIAIATPYDEEFVPMLTRWVAAARKYNLNVWFRGNFSGWEKWFGYKAMTRQEHLTQVKAFITKHPELFEDGDMFTGCPECENGGPGDPRQTGDIEGHRLFLIAEYTVAKDAFAQIHKNVSATYNSMNYDVARAIMDKRTTAALGGIVTIDHYVATPEKLASDIQSLAQESGGKIFLGEFGAPIPDIHGNMTDAQQDAWIKSALTTLASEPSVIGVNYWVNVGGSTEIWNNKGVAKPAVATIHEFFTPHIIEGVVKDQFDNLITNGEVSSLYKNVKTDSSGHFGIPILASETLLHARADGYIDSELKIDANSNNIKIIIQKYSNTILESIMDYIKGLFF